MLVLSVGASGLTVATDTADALCPALDQAREAVARRVGIVEGGPFVAHYSVVRNGSYGGKSLWLKLQGPDGALLLERQIPLDSSGCAVSAQAIAVVLESYFDSARGGRSEAPREEPASASDQDSSSSIDPPEESAPSQVSGNPVAAHDPPAADGSRGERPASEVPGSRLNSNESSVNEAPTGNTDPSKFSGALNFRAGGGVGAGFVPTVAVGVLHDPTPWFWATLDVLVPLSRREQSDRPYNFSTYTPSAKLGGLGVLSAERWSFGLGPLVGVHWQMAELHGENVIPGDPRSRWLGGAGFQGQVSYRATSRWSFDLTYRGEALLLGRPFVVQESEGREQRSLSLPGFESGVTLALRYTSE